MLMQRVVTALVLLPLLLAAIFFAPTPWLYTLFSAAGILIAWEWTGIMGMNGKTMQRGIYLALTALLLAAGWQVPVALRCWIFGAAGLWWLTACALLPGFPENFRRRPPPKMLMGLLGLLLIVSTLLALATLHAMSNGVYKLIYLFFLIFAADTGAYLAGRNFGKHKLAPNVSPGKTVEGAIGGLLLCAAWSLTAGMWAFQPQGMMIWELLALSLLVAVFSIVGDLTESMFKRVAGLKDSGNILPGHGGILDRVDSLLAAAPIMVLGLQLLRLQ
ncbi:MAG: phosphatidate cytidylyltransferase [Stenotrophobium sp.]